MNYCPRCGHQLGDRTIDGHIRRACGVSGCGFVFWNNPVPVVAALVPWRDGYLLSRNAKWPPNLYSLVTGFLDAAETPEAAVVREVGEELGLTARHVEFIGHFPLPQLNQLLIAYAVPTTGKIALSHEIAEVKLVSSSELHAYDFGPLELSRAIVAQWLSKNVIASAELPVAADGETTSRARRERIG